MKNITLTQGQVAIVDDEDFEWLNQWKWCASYNINNDSYYAVRHDYLYNGKRILIRMHRQILDLEFGDKRQGDHIHHNTLDNRRSQLRIVTNRKNLSNLKDKDLCTSIYTGVYWNKKLGKWGSRIRIGKDRKFLGYFFDENKARDAYQNALLYR